MAYFDVAPFSYSMIPSPERDPRAFVTERCKQLGFDPADVRGPRRFHRLTEPRMVIARELYNTGLSLREVGIALGGRDHSTVWSLIHGGKGKGR